MLKEGGEIPLGLKCPACSKLFRDPIQCLSGHSVCATCMGLLCVQCHRYTERDIQRVSNVSLGAVIEGIELKCPHNDGGCVWTGFPSGVVPHLENDCKCREFPCPIACWLRF